MLARNPDNHLAALVTENAKLKDQLDHYRRELGLAQDDDTLSRFQVQWSLTRKEAAILGYLYRKGGAMASRNGIMDALYGDSPDEPGVKIVDVFLCKLRAKMGAGAYIDTVWGGGYRLSEAGLALCAGVLSQDPSAIQRAESDARPRHVRQAGTYRAVIDILRSQPMTARELAGRLGRAPGAAHAVLSTMRAAGLVERVDVAARHGNAKPASVWGATDKGARYVAMD